MEDTATSGQLKTCTRCGEAKPLSEFYGYRGACKPCWRARQAQYRDADPARQQAIDARYLEKNREQINARRRAAKAANPEPHRERCRQWYARNKEHSAAMSRAWREANREYLRAYDRARLESQKAAARRRRADDPLPFRVAAHHSRAAQIIADFIRFTADDLAADWERRGLTGCVWCTAGTFEHIDHVVPLTRGGAHTVDNLVPSCARCNQCKRNRTPDEWFAAMGA